MLNKSLWEKKIFRDSFLLKKFMSKKLKLWLYNQYKKEFPEEMAKHKVKRILPFIY
mgnify:CR=1 FL=1